MITDLSVIRSCRFGPRLVLTFFFFAVVAVATAQDISSTYLKGPYLQAPGADTMTIMWESSTNKPGIVRYGLGGVLDRVLRLEMPRALPAITNFSVTNITAEAPDAERLCVGGPRTLTMVRHGGTSRRSCWGGMGPTAAAASGQDDRDLLRYPLAQPKRSFPDGHHRLAGPRL